MGCPLFNRNTQLTNNEKTSALNHNWLVHRIHNKALEAAIHQYASGLLLDIGCGKKPYQVLTKGLVKQHFGLDHLDSLHGLERIDIVGIAYRLGVADNSVDTILCTVTLEHLEQPQVAIQEMYRILKPSGYLIVSAPLFWHLHEEPRDFYRYTKYGLAYLFSTAGFEILEIKPLAGFIVTFGQGLAYYLNRWRYGLTKYPIIGLQLAIQGAAYFLNGWDRSYDFTWTYLAVLCKNAK